MDKNGIILDPRDFFIFQIAKNKQTSKYLIESEQKKKTQNKHCFLGGAIRC